MNSFAVAADPSNEKYSVYGLVRILSLDVALGALTSGIFVSELTDQEMPWAWYVVLPVAVWLIYTLDHLLDARRLKDGAHTQRHLFHFRHFKVLAVIWGILALSGLGLAFAFFPAEGIYFGLAMGGVVLLHLAIVSLVGDKTSPFLIKEAGVGTIYALGIWGMPLVLAWGKPMPFDLILLMLIQFALLALINLVEFSLFERETDELDGQTSFVRAIGPVSATRFLTVLFVICLLLGAYVAFEAIQGEMWDLLKGEAIFLLMGVGLALNLLFPNFFAEKERYRTLGDAVFLLPVLFVLLR